MCIQSSEIFSFLREEQNMAIKMIGRSTLPVECEMSKWKMCKDDSNWNAWYFMSDNRISNMHEDFYLHTLKDEMTLKLSLLFQARDLQSETIVLGQILGTGASQDHPHLRCPL